MCKRISAPEERIESPLLRQCDPDTQCFPLRGANTHTC